MCDVVAFLPCLPCLASSPDRSAKKSSGLLVRTSSCRSPFPFFSLQVLSINIVAETLYLRPAAFEVHKMPLLFSHLLLLLFFAIRLSFSGPVPTKSFPALNATSADLYRRQCVLPTGATTYTCDDRLPTADEIVARIRDTSDEGGADADHRAVFWTNLIHDPSNAFRVEEIGWIQGWMEARGFPFYWYFEHINMHCELTRSYSCHRSFEFIRHLLPFLHLLWSASTIPTKSLTNLL